MNLNSIFPIEIEQTDGFGQSESRFLHNNRQ
jgi:hypothetical protein